MQTFSECSYSMKKTKNLLKLRCISIWKRLILGLHGDAVGSSAAWNLEHPGVFLLSLLFPQGTPAFSHSIT